LPRQSPQDRHAEIRSGARIHWIGPFGVWHALVPDIEDIGEPAECPGSEPDRLLDVQIELVDGRQPARAARFGENALADTQRGCPATKERIRAWSNQNFLVA
jgi:hypothetical protein